MNDDDKKCICGRHPSLMGSPDPEYDPACPVHSEHVYNPRNGVWELADISITAKMISRALVVLAARGNNYHEWTFGDAHEVIDAALNGDNDE